MFLFELFFIQIEKSLSFGTQEQKIIETITKVIKYFILLKDKRVKQ